MVEIFCKYHINNIYLGKKKLIDR